MKCTTVRTKLAGYLDDALTGTTSVAERVQIGEHLNGCTVCRAELETFRKLSVLLSRMPKNVPPADLAVRIKVAAAQAQHSHDWSSRLRKMRDRAEILLDNVFRPLTVPATGGVFSAIVVFVLRSAIDGAGHHLARRAQRCAARYSPSRRAGLRCRIIRKPGDPSSMRLSFLSRRGFRSMLLSTRAARWWTMKFFRVPRARLCAISSTRFFSSRVSVRC